MNGYQKLMKDAAPKHDPRHIEAFMRLRFGTLDHLDPETFREEAQLAAACVDFGGVEEAEALAESYGL